MTSYRLDYVMRARQLEVQTFKAWLVSCPGTRLHLSDNMFIQRAVTYCNAT